MHALQFNPSNTTAHYRLGLIAWGESDYELAASHLREAHDLRPGHRGVRKLLGQVLVWTGDLDEAYGHLRSIPESIDDMEHYERQWMNLGRDDLAANANAMASRLRDGEP